MQAVLGEQDVGEQLGPGAAARDRMRGRRRLGDRLAGAAGELLAHVLDHLPLPRHELQRLGDVLAELAQRPAAAARAGRRRRIDDALARQMLGQRPARRLAPLERWHRRSCSARCRHPCRRLGLRRILFQLGELQLELIEQRAALRGLPEPLVPQLGDRELQLLDQQRAVAAPRPLPPCAPRARQAASPSASSTSSGRESVGAHRRRWNHKTRSSCELADRADSQCRDQPAACGRQVCCGSRQSIPSSR